MAFDSAPPFLLAHELTRDFPSQHVPGYPRVSLDDKNQLSCFLCKELRSSELDKFADRLWWMSKQDSANISPLHRQRVKGRTIIITEDPKLHLVWIYDRIFIKPLPQWLCSYTFWNDHLCRQDGGGRDIREAALGFLRTYHHLVKHESDFRIAQDPSLCLVPMDTTWKQFCNFTSKIASVRDCDVSPRYAYGEIRLTRLNFYAPLILGKSNFQRIDYQYGAYFARLYGPILFVIGIASVILSAFQIIVSVGTEAENTQGWRMGAPLWISVVAIVCSFIILFSLGLILVYKVAMEWKVAIRDRVRLLEEKRAI